MKTNTTDEGKIAFKKEDHYNDFVHSLNPTVIDLSLQGLEVICCTVCLRIYYDLCRPDRPHLFCTYCGSSLQGSMITNEVMMGEKK